jgi:hypothetical protein
VAWALLARYSAGQHPAAAGETLPLAFERSLWAGGYALILRVEDLHSHRNFRVERPVEVPPPDALPEVAAVHQPPQVTAVLDAARAEVRANPPAAAPASAAAPAGSAAAAASPPGNPPAAAPSLHLVPPPGEQQAGGVRLEAQASGEGIRKVTFFLDGKEMLTRVRPPYSVELQLGPVPVTREVRVAAYAADGREVASDALVLNQPRQRFTASMPR